MPVFNFTQRHNATTFLNPRCGVVASCETFTNRCFIFLLFLLALLLPSCAVFKSKDTRYALKIKREVAQSPVFSKAFTGFTLLDPVSGKTLADFNGDHYFTPASNTKILTLAACLEILGDSVPGVQTIITPIDRKILFRGTGDPTFLNPFFNSWQGVFQKIYRDTSHSLLFVQRPMTDLRFGPGWAWDDTPEPYSAEKTDWPIYGGLMTVYNSMDSAQRKVSPSILQPMLLDKKAVEESMVPWGMLSTQYYLWPAKLENDTFQVPIIQAAGLVPLLLADTSKSIWISPFNTRLKGFEKIKNWRTLYSTPIDTVLRRMMHQSDNFIAEQMLLVCAGVKFDLLQQDTMIKWMLDSALISLPQRPKWVDGSGLSRYNLMTPQSIGQVLLKLWREQPHDRILSLFPAGGVSGTISDWYAGKDGKPYVFAKTGGMGGVHCLSGYVVCKSGKVLIFSFMHNNFVGSSKAWKAEMQRLLEQIRDGF